MKLFLQHEYAKCLSNAKPENQGKDPYPVVKLFTPDANCTWLISEIHDLDMAFGLCDLGVGFPELGYVSIPELVAVRGKLGLPVERDKFFKPKFRMSTYTEAAYYHRRIVEDESVLQRF